MAKGDRRPVGAPPVKRIELDESETKKRVILTVIFIAIAIAAFTVFLFSVLTTEDGWKTIEADYATGGCAGDFVFNYYLGGSEVSADEEYRSLVLLYSDLTEYAGCLFDPHTEAQGMANLATLNAHPNEEIQLDEVLYGALLTAHEAGRQIYLGAVCDDYRTQMLAYDTSFTTVELDPTLNEERAEYYRALSDFARSEEHIRLEFYDGGKVKLVLSEEYLSFAQNQEITVFVDFFRLKNAFIIDYLAEELIERGFMLGNLTSFDGYVRNLDDGENEYKFNIFDRLGNNIYRAGALSYSGRTAIVTMRNYPMGELDSYFYSTNSKGNEITPYIDIADGLYKSSTDNILAYSHSLRCADIALELYSVYVADSLDSNALLELADKGIKAIWGNGEELLINSPDINIVEPYSDATVSYTVVEFSAK